MGGNRQPNLRRLGGTVTPRVISRASRPLPSVQAWPHPGTECPSHVEGLGASHSLFLVFLAMTLPPVSQFPVIPQKTRLPNPGLLYTQLSGSFATRTPEELPSPVDPGDFLALCSLFQEPAPPGLPECFTLHPSPSPSIPLLLALLFCPVYSTVTLNVCLCH